VVEAVAKGQFHVWLGEEVDDALQLLTAMGADEVHRAVAGRMAEYAESLKAAAGEGEQPKTSCGAANLGRSRLLAG
jgi:hypothetical protein